MHSTLKLFLVLLLLLGAQSAEGGELITQPGDDLDALIVPNGPRDMTAYRVDAEVFGWNKDFTELACLGMELQRKPDGEQTGEGFLLVFETSSVEPIHNVHSIFITQGSTPHNPNALYDVRDRLYGVDEVHQRLWPKRPTRKWKPGAMKVEMVWEKVVQGDRCQPAVGFILDWKGIRRFQPHEQLPDISVSCDRIRLTDNRIYWGRKDVAAAMPRFELGSLREHENSFRHPVSALWSRGRALDIRIVTELTGKEVAQAKQVLSRYGRVRVTDGTPKATVLHVASDIQVLGARLLEDLGTNNAEVLEGDTGDIVFELASPQALSQAPVERLKSTEESTYLSAPPQGRRKSR